MWCCRWRRIHPGCGLASDPLRVTRHRPSACSAPPSRSGRHAWHAHACAHHCRASGGAGVVRICPMRYRRRTRRAAWHQAQWAAGRDAGEKARRPPHSAAGWMERPLSAAVCAGAAPNVQACAEWVRGPACRHRCSRPQAPELHERQRTRACTARTCSPPRPHPRTHLPPCSAETTRVPAVIARVCLRAAFVYSKVWCLKNRLLRIRRRIRHQFLRRY